MMKKINLLRFGLFMFLIIFLSNFVLATTIRENILTSFSGLVYVLFLAPIFVGALVILGLINFPVGLIILIALILFLIYLFKKFKISLFYLLPLLLGFLGGLIGYFSCKDKKLKKKLLIAGLLISLFLFILYIIFLILPWTAFID